jgi:hypothetical protein
MMRYRFVDEIVTLELGDRPRIEIRKTFDPMDDALSGPTGRACVPAALVLELLAMTGGHLIFHRLGATRVPVLLKARDVRFDADVPSGRPLRATAQLSGLAEVSPTLTTAETVAEVYANDRIMASGRLFYACASVPGIDLARYAETR